MRIYTQERGLKIVFRWSLHSEYWYYNTVYSQLNKCNYYLLFWSYMCKHTPSQFTKSLGFTRFLTTWSEMQLLSDVFLFELKQEALRK